MLESHYNLSLSLLYAGFKRVETWWNFKDVISPFYRLYYIKEGEGRVYMNQTTYTLTAGQLFLIPKFIFHSYACDDYLDQYYICFFDDMLNGKGIPNPLLMNFQTQAGKLDLSLMERYLQLNPGKALASADPKQYDNDRLLYKKDSTQSLSHLPHKIESDGILLQLFSRFINEESLRIPATANSHEKLGQVIRHIEKNLSQRISVTELAGIMCVTSDHCSKIFKRTMGMSPCEYIQMKRIERAQTLLLTTQLPILRIAEKIGIGNLSQFSRLFSKVTQYSPREYRIMQLEEPNRNSINLQ